MQTTVDEGQERGETSRGVESSLFENETIEEPCEGMEFESEGTAKAFYDKYARRIGFLTRVLSSRKSERDRSIISRGIGCRGRSDNHIQGQKRDKRQEACSAMILLKREKPGKWVVRKFVRDHNHSLVISQQKSRPSLDDKDKKIQELMAELRVKKRLSAAYREQLNTFIKDVEEHNERLSVKVQVAVDNLKELETKRKELLQIKKAEHVE